MDQPEPERKKPRGTSVMLEMGPDRLLRVEKVLPARKPAIEQHFAELFCKDNQCMRPHFKRFGRFDNLCAQDENDLDFKVETDLGAKWLELAEFAPIKEVGHYENSTGVWDSQQQADLFINLVRKKNSKGYGSDVILMIYATHDHFWVPPPTIRMMPELLKNDALIFDAVYMVSPNGTVMEAWPGDPDSQGPKGLGSVRVGPFSSKSER